MVTFKEYAVEKVFQPGGAFEDLFYNQTRQLLKKHGSFKLKLSNKVYDIVGVEPPAGAETVKADLVLFTRDGNNVYISLKQFPFPAYAGIAGKGRSYLQAIATHPTVQQYVQHFKTYLLKKQRCVDSPVSLPSSTGEEPKWLNNNQKARKLTQNTICSRGGEEVYWEPANDKSFINLVVYGSPEYKGDKDYVDYVIKGKRGLSQPFKEIKQGLYTTDPSLTVMPYGSKVDGDMTPVFFSRTMNGRNAYGILNTRTQIVPQSEAIKRAKKI